MDSRKAWQSYCGPDEIHPRVLYELRQELAQPLHILLSSSLAQGKVPEHWKDATVIPIFKKGSKSDPANTDLLDRPCCYRKSGFCAL